MPFSSRGRHKRAARKGIDALILTTGAVSSIGCPSYFSLLPFNSQSKPNVGKQGTANVPGKSTTTTGLMKNAGGGYGRAVAVPLTTGLAASRRVASTSALSTNVAGIGSVGVAPAAEPDTVDVNVSMNDTRKANQRVLGVCRDGRDGCDNNNSEAVKSMAKGVELASNNNKNNKKDNNNVKYSDEDDDDFEAFAAECDRIEAEVNAKTITTSTTAKTQQQQTHRLDGAIHARHPIGVSQTQKQQAQKQSTHVETIDISRKHRAVSAPSLTGLSCPPDLLENDWGEDDDVVFRPEEWAVMSVKMKAEDRHRLHRGNGGVVSQQRDQSVDNAHGVNARVAVDDWADDFDLGGNATTTSCNHDGLRTQKSGTATLTNNSDKNGDDEGTLVIPEFVAELQSRLRADIFNMHKFALHAEDLRLLWLDASDMAAGITTLTKPISPGINTNASGQLDQVRSRHAKTIERIGVVLDLADMADDDGHATSTGSKITSKHIAVLGDILLDHDDSDVKTTSAIPTPSLSPDIVASLQSMLSRGVVVFEHNVLEALISRIPPLKVGLQAYMRDLRTVAMRSS